MQRGAFGCQRGALYCLGVDRAHSSKLVAIAESQFGLFSVHQAIASGVPRAVVQRACEAGQLRRVQRGVYALTGRPVSRWEPHIAAALAVGTSGALSHDSAVAVHALPVVASRVEVTLTEQIGRRSVTGAVLHRSVCLTRADIVVRRGVQVTSPARTLMDMAHRWGSHLTEKVLDEGLIARAWSIGDIAECLGRLPDNFRGRRLLERAVEVRKETAVADSALEARMLAVMSRIDGFGMMAVHHQIVLGGSVYVVDAAWPQLRVAAEVVGRAHRVASRTSFDKERRKLNSLAAAGWQVAHITSVMAEDEVVHHVRSLLAHAAGRSA